MQAWQRRKKRWKQNRPFRSRDSIQKTIIRLESYIKNWVLQVEEQNTSDHLLSLILIQDTAPTQH